MAPRIGVTLRPHRQLPKALATTDPTMKPRPLQMSTDDSHLLR